MFQFFWVFITVIANYCSKMRIIYLFSFFLLFRAGQKLDTWLIFHGYLFMVCGMKNLLLLLLLLLYFYLRSYSEVLYNPLKMLLFGFIGEMTPPSPH